jgi:hypothetical protein
MTAPHQVATVPPGWETNPSAWSQRLPIVAVAMVGFVVATYLTLFQYGAVGVLGPRTR